MTSLQEIFSATEEDAFVDLTFTLGDFRQSSVGTELVARGAHEGHPVGFSAVLHGNWEPQQVPGMDAHLFWGRVSLRSLGAESNSFLAALRSLYGLPPSPLPMKNEVDFTAAGLGDDPRGASTQPVRLKLFYEPPGKESENVEVYLNIDAARSVVEFNEKDEGYREPLLAALTSQPAREGRRPWWKLW